VVITAHQVDSYGPNVTESDRTPGPAHYEVRVAGHLAPHWAEWFGLDITSEVDGTSVLSGPVVDQAALHGLLHKLSDLGLPIESLTHKPPGATS
jgi:hypothetical protein